MRLYLSSFRIGDDPAPLIRLAGASARVAVIVNALDAAPADDRAERVGRELSSLAGLGFDASEVDLRDLSDGDDAATRLTGFDALWVCGGNVFVLRRPSPRAEPTQSSYGCSGRTHSSMPGTARDPCVLAPSLRGLEDCDPVADVRRVYGIDARYDGLGVLPYAIVPHLDTPDHPESAVLGRVAARYDADGTPYRGLRDGEALVLDGGDGYVVGRR